MGIIINGQNDTIGPVDNTMSLLGTVSIGGTMTIEDFTNIDSVGLITARNGVNVTAGDVNLTSGNLALASATPMVVASNGSGHLRLGAGGSEKVRITSAGNVGVGTDTPGAILEVFDATSNTILNVRSGDAGAVLNLIDDSARSSIEQIGTTLKISSDTGAEDANSDIRLQVDGSSKMIIRDSGDVIAGVPAHDNQNHTGSRTVFTVADTTNGALLQIRGQSPAAFFDVSSGGIGKVFLDGADFAIQSGTPASEGTERLRIDSVGNSKFISNARQVIIRNDGTSGFPKIDFRNAADTGDAFAFINGATIDLQTNGSTRVHISNSGLVGINCTPLAQLQVKAGTNANIALTTMSSEAAVEAFNDAGSANVPLRIRGSAVKLYANTNLRLDVQNAQSYLYGTSDGILNLDTTDGRGAFIRFKENGTTKAWVGCAEGMGGGTSSPDQDDLGLRATGNILFSSNGGERLRITENGRVLINRSTATGQAINNLNGDVKLVVNGATITKHGYKADVGTSYVNIPGATVGNETSVFLVTVQGNGGGNFHSSATYILCSGAYNKTFTQLGSAAGHFGNGTVQAQLSSYSGTSSSVQVRRSGSSGTCSVQVHMFQLL